MTTRTIVRVTWNLFFKGRPQTHAQREQVSWYQKRWSLWKRFTEPSLLRQTHTDFAVWIMCDPKLRHLTDWMSDVLPDDRFRVTYNWNADCREVAAEKPERIILARIDNDDAYAADALATYHAAVDDLGERNTIQLANGWVWDQEKSILYESANPSPAFMAMVGGWQMMEHRFPQMGNHSKAQFTALRVPGHKWLMCCHGNNVCNKAAGAWIGRKVTGQEREDVMTEYGLEVPADG